MARSVRKNSGTGTGTGTGTWETRRGVEASVLMDFSVHTARTIHDVRGVFHLDVARPQLDDRQWAKLEPLLVSGARGGRPPKDNRNFIEAVLWWRRTGVPWRDLPETFGPWKTVFNRFDRWSKAGKWARLFQALQTDRDDEWHTIDSTINRAHQHSAGGKGGLLSRASVVHVGDSRRRSI